MLIFLWVIACLFYAAIIALLLLVLLNKLPVAISYKTWLRQWFAEFRRHGFFPLGLNKYPVELWKWETMDDEEVCEDCLERASWPPMDIADWMKEGIPRTPEAETKCGKNCRCELVQYHPHSTPPRHPRKPQ